MTELKSLFNPKSVAVVGASKEPYKIGWNIVRNLKTYFKGKIYPVNPNAGEVLGLKAFPSVTSVPDDIDLCIICVPAQHVSKAVRECGMKNAKVAVIITAGFKEVGNSKLEEEVINIARTYNMRVVGPNCNGVYVPKTGVISLFENIERVSFPKPGNIAFISQSGAIGAVIMELFSAMDEGISKFVSLGNRADVDETDILRYLADDPDTRVIAMYIESVKRGQAFVETLKEVTLKKPVVVIKPGRSEVGARAVLSHTGSLAGSDKIYDAVFNQVGAVRTYDIESFLDVVIAFSKLPPSAGRRVAVLTVSGGLGAMASDAVAELGLEVPRLSDATVKKLKEVLMPFASPYNPIDTTASVNDEQLLNALEILLRSDEVDVILFIPIMIAPSVTEELPVKFARHYKEVSKELNTPIPLVAAVVGGSYSREQATKLKEHGIPTYPSVERAAKVLTALYKYGNWLKRNGTFHEYIEKLKS